MAFLRGVGGGLFEIAPPPPGLQSKGGPKMRNLTIAAMTGQVKSSGPKMVKGPFIFGPESLGPTKGPQFPIL